MPATNLVRRLKTLEFFQGVDEASIALLAEAAVWKVYASDAVIFWEGDTEASLYYLQYGWLKVIKTGPDGREQTLRFLGEGEVFNEVGVFAGRPNPATAIALEESGLWLIPRSALQQLLASHPETAGRVMQNMADRIASLVELTADLSLRTVEARLAKLLLEQVDGAAMPRRRWATLTELAAHLGTVPDVLGRVIRELTREGLIQMDKEQIRILDRPGLAERARLPVAQE